MDNFTELVSFYADTIVNFLMAEPIIYLVGAVISLFCIKIIISIFKLKGGF